MKFFSNQDRHIPNVERITINKNGFITLSPALARRLDIKHKDKAGIGYCIASDRVGITYKGDIPVYRMRKRSITMFSRLIANHILQGETKKFYFYDTFKDGVFLFTQKKDNI